MADLFMANIRIVARTVAEFSPRALGHSLDEDDLLQEAYHSFENAIAVFDPEKGALSTLLVKSIRRHLRRVIENKGYEIRIPVMQHGRLRRITFARESGRAGHTETHDRRLVAEIAGLTEAQVRYVEHLPRVSLSLDDQISPDDARVVSDVAPLEDETFDPIVLLDHEALLTLLGQALDSKTLSLVCDVYGLNETREPMTATEAAKRHKTTRARVTAAVSSAITILQTPYFHAEIRRLLGANEEDGDGDAEPD